MLVALHRKRLVSTLVDMAQSRIAPVFLPATHMGDRQPLHKGRQLAIALRPQKQVPVVGHHRVRTNPHRRLIKSILQNLLECLVVGRFLEQLHSRHAAIQDVKNHSTKSDPRCSWHRRTIIQNSPSCQYRTRPAFAFVPLSLSASSFCLLVVNIVPVPLSASRCQYRTCPAFCLPLSASSFSISYLSLSLPLSSPAFCLLVPLSAPAFCPLPLSASRFNIVPVPLSASYLSRFLPLSRFPL